jgi:hypothetical protein
MRHRCPVCRCITHLRRIEREIHHNDADDILSDSDLDTPFPVSVDRFTGIRVLSSGDV